MKNNTIGYIAVFLLLSITALFSLNLFFQQRKAEDRLDIGTFPYAVGEWQGKDLEVTEKEYAVLETRNLILREYSNPQEEKLYLFVIYSETNRSVFHPPEVCLMGSGVNITDKQPEQVPYGQGNFLTNKLYLEKNGQKEIALYCYKAGRLYTDNYYLQQAYFALNQLLRRQQGGATIRASMLINDDQEVTVATLKGFLAQAAEIIDTLPVQ